MPIEDIYAGYQDLLMLRAPAAVRLDVVALTLKFLSGKRFQALAEKADSRTMILAGCRNREVGSRALRRSRRLGRRQTQHRIHYPADLYSFEGRAAIVGGAGFKRVQPALGLRNARDRDDGQVRLVVPYG